MYYTYAMNNYEKQKAEAVYSKIEELLKGSIYEKIDLNKYGRLIYHKDSEDGCVYYLFDKNGELYYKAESFNKYGVIWSFLKIFFSSVGALNEKSNHSTYLGNWNYDTSYDKDKVIYEYAINEWETAIGSAAPADEFKYMLNMKYGREVWRWDKRYKEFTDKKTVYTAEEFSKESRKAIKFYNGDVIGAPGPNFIEVSYRVNNSQLEVFVHFSILRHGESLFLHYYKFNNLYDMIKTVTGESGINADLKKALQTLFITKYEGLLILNNIDYLAEEI